MSSSGTYNFAPSNADLVLGALGRIRIRPTEVTTEHLQKAYQEANYLLVEFANKQPNLWESELLDLTLAAGTATYSLPQRTVMVLIAYLRTSAGDQGQQDRILYPCSTTEYASYPNKLQQGLPTVYWFNRQIIPQVSFYQCPNDTMTVKLQCVRQMQDANLPSGETPDLPYRWFDAFLAGLAYRLSRYYAPDLEQMRKADAAEAWAVAATNDVENVPLSISADFTAYRV